MEDGTIVERTSGTPQGGVISPVLANLFLHYVFDDFMVKEFGTIPWARYADDGIAHCVSLKQAKYLKRRLEQRFRDYGLELNLEKTRIVYCKDDDRRGSYENTSFDFLGHTFRPWHAKNRYGKFFTNFLPAISEKAKKSIRKEVRGWSNYHKHTVASKTFSNVNNSLYLLLQRWAKHCHPNKTSWWRLNKYWHRCGDKPWLFSTTENALINLRTIHIARHPNLQLTKNPLLDQGYFKTENKRLG